ncbi:MAG: cytochrome ubiquinol oxidase subunit I [Rubrobacteraceae bacterium]|uniref:cytochrome ubiquinol oxidase subunit I n=1 Tax=Rubrobacter naiadicus TaxID=1392641 RepID=UPI0023631527|nr:cytochrome ubiquinol oxidase subunit I [Rubrobacter naiadicus]MBX6765072.1 cytochrome ubiquinol oxidase subunit I [Rubrobacteraceae bacterium]MCL6437491.1 cytochrome ubiquinol oxidase subunit I [Rubrobacteraceae bacterium]
MILSGSGVVVGLLQGNSEAWVLDRWQFGGNLLYHYLYPQFNMGIILLIFIIETLHLRTRKDFYRKAADFWVKIFAPAFVIGAVTGIPLEFGFGTNWAIFSKVSGGVIGQTLAMEGVFAFFLESAFLAIYIYGQDMFGAWGRWVSALAILVGSWGSAYFILSVNAWMQHPVGYEKLPDGQLALKHFWEFLLNPWLYSHQLEHVLNGAVITGCFAMAGLGAFYVLSGRDVEYGRFFVTLGVVVGVFASLMQVWPFGDAESRAVSEQQPIKLAAQEGVFDTERGAPWVLIGQISMEQQKIVNPVEIPRFLSFLAYRDWNSRVEGLDAFPKKLWPDNVPFVYYGFRSMVLLGFLFAGMMVLAALLLLWGGRLFRARWMLWVLMLSPPLPFVANSVGWITAETGRQPWIAYGLLRTSQSASPLVGVGSLYFTLAGMLGVFALLSLLYAVIVLGLIRGGPEEEQELEGEELKVGG